MDTVTAISKAWAKLRVLSRQPQTTDQALLRVMRDEIVRTAYNSSNKPKVMAREVGAKLNKKVYSPIAHRMQPLHKVVSNGIAFYGWDKKTVLNFVSRKLSQ